MLKSVSKPVKKVSVLRKLIFALVNLPPDLPNLHDVVEQFATKDEEFTIPHNEVKVLLENIYELDSAAFATDAKLLQELLKFQVTKRKPLGCVLISPNENCLLCKRKMLLRKDRPAMLTIYDDKLGTVPGSHYHKYCSCGFTQYYGYYTTMGSTNVYYNSNWDSLDYFVSSRETAFSLNLLKQFNAEILIGQQSFKQCADVYNYLHSSSEGIQLSEEILMLNERQKVDRRRVEDAFFQYALLKAASWHPTYFDISHLPLHGKSVDTISVFSTVYHAAFMDKYSGHSCSTPGCGKALVIDGNMKNRRHVCAATHAGYTEYKGLSGRVRTGCPNTPAHKSQYCTQHKPCIATSDAPGQPSEPVGIITGKRSTRTSTSYEVVWLGRPITESTWQPAASLPSSLIEEYEGGIRRGIQSDFSSLGGQTICTLTSVLKQAEQPAPKKPCLNPSSNESCTNGVFLSSGTDLTCNTNKDKSVVKEHTAGIVVGAWPCGTILMIGELFGSESMSQVYGNIHTFLQDNHKSTKDLDFLIYDDACHLKRYAAKRKSVSSTAERIASVNTVVDRFHFSGHIDPWCRQNCNPDSFDDLKMVDTEVCEQLFSWLSRYGRITKHMSKEHFLFYILYLCDQHNQMEK